MEIKNEEKNEFFSIDIMQIVKDIWYKIWLVILCGIIGAGAGFAYAGYYLTPKYSSSALLYVNGNSLSLGGQKLSISSSDISVARSLVDTYIVILNNRTTLEAICEEANLSYSSSRLSSMVSASAVGETEVLRVTVTSNDPYEAANIANAITVVLPKRISMIISGATMEVVDTAVPNLNKIGPNVSKYTLVGFVGAAFLCMAIIALLSILDNTIHSADYISSTYDFPVLARIPDFRLQNSSKYGYSYKYGYAVPIEYDNEGTEENTDGKE